MADIVLTRDQGIPQGMRTRYRDMGDGTHALVSAAEVAGATIGSIAVPTDSPRTNQAVIAITGTAVRLSAASVPLPGGSVFLTAAPANAAVMTAGGSDVTNAIDGTGNGLLLAAGGNGIVFAADLNTVWVNGTAGDVVSWSAG